MSGIFSLPCGICLESLTENSSVTLVPCGHCYHEHCIQKVRRNNHYYDEDIGRVSLENSDSCPECRM